MKKVILLIETSRAFGRDLLTGIARYSRLHGSWSFYREPSGLKSAIPHVENWNADGIIMRNKNITDSILKLNIPIIAVLHYKDSESLIPKVITNAKRISQLAAEHLLNRGFSNFAFCGYRNFDWSVERQNYFNQYLKRKNINCFNYKTPNTNKFKNWQIEIEYMTNWLISLPKPIGIMACNDDRGQHVLEACKLASIKVPEEIAVIGVDNDTLICDLCDPPLTSIALNTEVAGYKCAELLDKLMNGGKSNGEIIDVSPTHVVSRQSTDILAITDKEVVKALSFIRDNAKNKIDILDVVNSTALSRRSLEKKFRSLLGKTILEEIRRIRIELIASMLTETDMTISEITSHFNFTDIEHISRYFKSVKGVSLREFRKLQK